jgi:SAM-dependent methyltransferase
MTAPRTLSSNTPTPPPTEREVPHEEGYAYYWRDPEQHRRHIVEAEAMSGEILQPSLQDPNYLVLEERRKIFSRWIANITATGLRILDIGGRLQPYRPLFESRADLYVGLDPVLEGLVNVVGVGEKLPFACDAFDVVVCTQALNYMADPFGAIGEIFRVLAPLGFLFLSTPAIFPRYFDQRWRFMPEGLRTLLAAFSNVHVVAEGGSIAGFCRTINLFAETFAKTDRQRWISERIVYPTVNRAGIVLDRFSHGRTEFATNYSCLAQKVV